MWSLCRCVYPNRRWRGTRSPIEHLSVPSALWHADRVPGEELGRWSQQSMEDTLTRQRDVLGYDHPDTLRLAHNLAAGLRALGEHQQARQLDEDTLTRYRRVLGDDHPDTLRSAHNLVANLRALGLHELARELGQDTLSRRRRVL